MRKATTTKEAITLTFSGKSRNTHSYAHRILIALNKLEEDQTLELVVGEGSYQDRTLAEIKVTVEGFKDFLNKVGSDSDLFNIIVLTAWEKKHYGIN